MGISSTRVETPASRWLGSPGRSSMDGPPARGASTGDSNSRRFSTRLTFEQTLIAPGVDDAHTQYRPGRTETPPVMHIHVHEWRDVEAFGDGENEAAAVRPPRLPASRTYQCRSCHGVLVTSATTASILLRAGARCSSTG
jgi:hypothetical protein